MNTFAMANQRPRAADLGLKLGLLPRGPLNTITDVPGVRVGHVTLIEGEGPLEIGQGPIRTGVTAILAHGGNIFQNKVTAAVHVINGYGKSLGLPQITELGAIESPIALTSTLSVWRVADTLVDYLSQQNPGIYSFNPVVGECNDGFLNDGVGRHVRKEHVFQAIEEASGPNTDEGNVGAGTGMTGFGWKAGIGTSSRLCQCPEGTYTVGVLTLTNTGDPRELMMDGFHIERQLMPPKATTQPAGSIMIIVGTDAPVSSRQMGCLARRAALGMARVGAIAHHGSGDFVIAFSNSDQPPGLDDTNLTSLFRGTIEATEEAIINSILRAETLTGRDGNTRYGIPIDEVTRLLSNVSTG